MSKIVSHENIGDKVLCDVCNTDYTTSKVTGGIYFSGNAICPECTPDFEKAIEKYNETHLIQSRCPADKSYADWVREDLRGGKPGTITVSTF